MTAPDALAVLKRADQRWATKHADDPNPVAYLQHLAAALTPLLQPGTAAVDLDHATELNQLRADLDAAKADAATLADQAAQLQRHLGRITRAITGTWRPRGDHQQQVGDALNQIRIVRNYLTSLHTNDKGVA